MLYILTKSASILDPQQKKKNKINYKTYCFFLKISSNLFSSKPSQIVQLSFHNHVSLILSFITINRLLRFIPKPRPLMRSYGHHLYLNLLYSSTSRCFCSSSNFLNTRFFIPGIIFILSLHFLCQFHSITLQFFMLLF
jgi:hypothetical protein